MWEVWIDPKDVRLFASLYDAIQFKKHTQQQNRASYKMRPHNIFDIFGKFKEK